MRYQIDSLQNQWKLQKLFHSAQSNYLIAKVGPNSLEYKERIKIGITTNKTILLQRAFSYTCKIKH
jgi:hypothetical protein